jgi:hypothetical protein
MSSPRTGGPLRVRAVMNRHGLAGVVIDDTGELRSEGHGFSAS